MSDRLFKNGVYVWFEGELGKPRQKYQVIGAYRDSISGRWTYTLRGQPLSFYAVSEQLLCPCC